MMERLVHVPSRLGAQCLESLAPLSAGRTSAAARAVDAAAAAAAERHDPGLARPLVVWSEWMRGSGRHARHLRPGATQLANAIGRAWRCALRAFSAHLSSLSEGERHRVASAFGPALAAAMHAQTDRRLRAATARVCLHVAHADFMARAGVRVPEDLVAECAELVDVGGDGAGGHGGDGGGDGGGEPTPEPVPKPTTTLSTPTSAPYLPNRSDPHLRHHPPGDYLRRTFSGLPSSIPPSNTLESVRLEPGGGTPPRTPPRTPPSSRWHRRVPGTM